MIIADWRPKNSVGKMWPALAVWLAIAPGASGQATPSEYEVKAAFLYNFAKYVEWPDGTFADERGPFRFGVLGEDPFGKALENVFGNKEAQGRRVEIERSSRVEDLLDCHILFIAKSEENRKDEILKALEGARILTVWDVDNRGPSGVMIRLARKDNRIGVEIDLKAAEKAGLRVSSQLLRIAEVVGEKTGTNG